MNLSACLVLMPMLCFLLVRHQSKNCCSKTSQKASLQVSHSGSLQLTHTHTTPTCILMCFLRFAPYLRSRLLGPVMELDTPERLTLIPDSPLCAWAHFRLRRLELAPHRDLQRLGGAVSDAFPGQWSSSGGWFGNC